MVIFLGQHPSSVLTPKDGSARWCADNLLTVAEEEKVVRHSGFLRMSPVLTRLRYGRFIVVAPSGIASRIMPLTTPMQIETSSTWQRSGKSLPLFADRVYIVIVGVGLVMENLPNRLGAGLCAGPGSHKTVRLYSELPLKYE